MRLSENHTHTAVSTPDRPDLSCGKGGMPCTQGGARAHAGWWNSNKRGLIKKKLTAASASHLKVYPGGRGVRNKNVVSRSEHKTQPHSDAVSAATCQSKIDARLKL